MHNHAVIKSVIPRLVKRGQQSKLAALRHDKRLTYGELNDISADLPRFNQAFTELATRLGLDIAPLEADHISLRCHQNATAERWRRGFEQCGELLSENIINGRPICLFKLHEPVCVAHWQFSVVELPWPGEKRYPHEGWEHIEIVLPGEPETLNARALALLSDEGLRSRVSL